MSKYLVHYDSDKSEIQLREQHSQELGFCHIREAIPINRSEVPNGSGYFKDEWLNWHDKWTQYFIRKYRLNPNDVQ